MNLPDAILAGCKVTQKATGNRGIRLPCIEATGAACVLGAALVPFNTDECWDNLNRLYFAKITTAMLKNGASDAEIAEAIGQRRLNGWEMLDSLWPHFSTLKVPDKEVLALTGPRRNSYTYTRLRDLVTVMWTLNDDYPLTREEIAQWLRTMAAKYGWNLDLNPAVTCAPVV